MTERERDEKRKRREEVAKDWSGEEREHGGETRDSEVLCKVEKKRESETEKKGRTDYE